MTEQREQQASGAASGRSTGTVPSGPGPSAGSAPLHDSTRPLAGREEGSTGAQERAGGWQDPPAASPPAPEGPQPPREPVRQEQPRQEQPRPAAGAAPRPPGPAPAPPATSAATTARPGVPRSAPRPGDRTPRPAASAGRQRRARLRLQRIDPWSVFVLSLLVSLFLAVVLVVAVVALYAVLEAAGVPDSVNALASEVTRSPGEADPAPLLSAGRALTTAGVVAVVDVVLLTALATLSAVLYNLCASFTGGLEVTLAENDG